jgi:hypothetical protein
MADGPADVNGATADMAACTAPAKNLLGLIKALVPAAVTQFVAASDQCLNANEKIRERTLK